MLQQYPPGATPLDEDEAADLIPSHISTQAELNEWEQANIAAAMRRVRSKRRVDVLDVGFLLGLHSLMFNQTWKWAGTVRRTDKNIGSPWTRIRMDLRELLDDVKFWKENGSLEPDEIATRFHHRLVLIHPFPNGNGRHARAATDLLLTRTLNRPAFTWGGGADLQSQGEKRIEYIKALQAADRSDFNALLSFVRS